MSARRELLKTVAAAEKRNAAMTEPATSGIRCAHCKGRHPSVADVRTCSQGGKVGLTGRRVGYNPADDTSAMAGADNGMEMPTARDRVYTGRPASPFKPASDKQVTYLAALEGKHVDEVHAENLSSAQASARIGTALKAPKEAKPRGEHWPDVPAGRYAITAPSGETKFYKVDRPTEGPHAGRTFVKVQASDELHRVYGSTALAVLKEIAKDPKAAMIRYGMEIGACGHCGRTLTNPDSRAAGIGPICAGKMGW